MMRLIPLSIVAFFLLLGIAGCADPAERGAVQTNPPDPLQPLADVSKDTSEGSETSDAEDPDGEENSGDATADAEDPDGKETGDAEESDTESPSDASDPDSESGDDSSDGGEGPKPSKPYAECDAGDVAWATRAIQVILGRNPAGLEESRAIAAMVAATSREAVARQLMERPSYIPRWRDFLMDEVRVNRVGDKAQYDCYGDMLDSGDGGALAKHIRDSSPDVDYPGGTTTMSEVLVSSLELDDLSPFYRAHLFAMMSKPITGANVAALEMDITRRQDFGEIFSAVYTHRNVVCAGCHNSEWGVTDSNDPEEDKHWALPGLFEKAIYGTSVGRDEMEVYSAFRHLNVVENNGERPWGMSGNCGRFRAKENIPVDPADVDAYFVSALGKTASIWDVENALHQGCDMLREDGLQVDPETQEVDANEGLAYLLASRVANQVWQEAYGSPLTLVHYIPRNKEQRDILLDLTTVYIENGFSLRSLLVEVVTHPLFNQLDPASGCDPNTAYILPPVMNPWVLSEPDPSMQLNSVGDGVHRKPARLMLRSLSYAMDWPSAAAYPGGNDEEFQKAIGVFVKDAEPGFLGVDFQGMLSWESRYGACANQDNGIDWILHLLDGMGDFQIATQGTASARQVIIALKDRLLTQPSLEEGEAEFLAAFLGIESLDADAVTIPELQNSLRQLCGVLVESPQFLLAGSTQNMDTWLPPDIVVKGVSFKSMCEEAAETMFAKGWVLTCGDTELTLEEE